MNKGVSTEVGLIIILTVIAIAVGSILTSSRMMTESIITSNHESEMRASIILLKSNFDKVVYRNFPSRETEIRVFEGSLSYENKSYIIIGGEKYYLGSIVYESGNMKIILENGALFTYYGDDFVIDQYPNAISLNKTSIFPLIQIKMQGSMSVGGEVTLRIRIVNLGGGVIKTESFKIYSENIDVWERILKDRGFNYTRYPDHLEVNEEVYLKSSIVGVEFSG